MEKLWFLIDNKRTERMEKMKAPHLKAQYLVILLSLVMFASTAFAEGFTKEQWDAIWKSTAYACTAAYESGWKSGNDGSWVQIVRMSPEAIVRRQGLG